jgi:hypothetical protein
LRCVSPVRPGEARTERHVGALRWKTGLHLAQTGRHIDRVWVSAVPGRYAVRHGVLHRVVRAVYPRAPVTDVDLVMVLGSGVGKTSLIAELADRLTTKLDKYYDKTTGTMVDGVPDAPSSRPDTFKIAVRAIKSHSLGRVVVQRSRSIAVIFPENSVPIDVLPALNAAADGASSAMRTSRVPFTELAEPGAASRAAAPRRDRAGTAPAGT